MKGGRSVSEPVSGTAPRPCLPRGMGGGDREGDVRACLPSPAETHRPSLGSTPTCPQPLASGDPTLAPRNRHWTVAGPPQDPGQRQGGPGLCNACSARTVRSGPDREAGSAAEGSTGLSRSRQGARDAKRPWVPVATAGSSRT